MTTTDPRATIRRAWLLHAVADAELGDALARRGLLGRAELTRRRPEAWLGMVEGRPAFAAEPIADLMAMVRRGPVWAFSTAPSADLDRLDGLEFWHDCRRVRVSRLKRLGAESPGSEPYASRFVRLEWAGVAPPTDLALLLGSFPPGAPRLWIDPPALDLPAETWDRWLEEPSPVGRSAWLTPPVRVDFEASSYFHPARRAARAAIRASAGSAEPDPDEPAVMALWRLVDHPLLRDFLIDGAALRPTNRPGESTRLRLEVPDPTGPTAAYRARAFGLIPRRSGSLSDWVEDVQARLLDDLETAGSSGLELGFEPGLAAQDWSVEVVSGGDRGGPANGSRQRLAALVAAVADAETRGLIAKSALGPDPEIRDHDAVERRFLAHFARSPWPDSAHGPWRAAVIAELLRYGFRARARTPQERFDEGDRNAWLELETTRNGRTLRHAEAPPALQLRWRLAMPLATVFEAIGSIRLDTPAARLDGHFTLA